LLQTGVGKIIISRKTKSMIKSGGKQINYAKERNLSMWVGKMLQL